MDVLRGRELVIQTSAPYINTEARAVFPYTNYRGTIWDSDELVEIGEATFLRFNAVSEKGERVPLLLNTATIQWIEIADGPRIAVPTMGRPK
jgi:hypothetical protein